MSSEIKFNIDFLGKRYIAGVFSTFLIIGAFYLWFSAGETKYGTDFTGGHSLVVQIPQDKSVEDIRVALEAATIEAGKVQSFESKSSQYSIQLGGASSEVSSIRTNVETALKKALGESSSVIQTDFVGPTVGAELRRQAFWATLLSLIAILAYIAYRFEMAFAIGAVAALFHDVIIATGVYLLAGHEINMSTVAAALTIVGYSVNDTIVVFDRVREELRKQTRDYDLTQLMNFCMNACLTRTIITSLLTLFSALALLLVGGGAISDLSLYLVAGLISGTYSTIYIAAPVVIWWHKLRGGKNIVASDHPVTEAAKV